MESSQPCQRCQIISTDHERVLFSIKGFLFQHSPTYLALSGSASKGCQICKLLAGVLLQNAKSKGKVVDLFTSLLPVAIFAAWSKPPEPISLNVRVHYNDDILSRPIIEAKIFVYTTYGNASTQDPRLIGRNISEHSNSLQCFSLIHQWLNTCLESHSNCLQGDLKLLPSRVIDLRPRDESKAPYLLLTNGEVGRYATLSHCWGPKERRPLTTTIETLEERRRSLLPEQLPKSFLDAISIARTLGIEYLWIDSLCIIQDSPADWAEQSALMADIYGNSFLTIAASNSPDSHAGIFNTRDSCQADCSLPFKSKYMTEQGSIYLRHETKAYIPGEESEQVYNHEVEVFVEPLYTRAWVLQERILAPRIINYGTAELFWECQTVTVHESIASSISRSPTAEMKRALAPRQTDDNLAIELPEPENLKSIYTRWYSVVEAYTRLQITYESDKFPAFSGLAQVFRHQTNDEYLAGLWKADFHRALLWRPEGIDRAPFLKRFPRRKPQKWRAPSWSWAAWDGPINPSLVSHQRRVPYAHDAKFLDVQVTPISEHNMLQRLKGGFLKVAGLCAVVGLGQKGFAASKLTVKGVSIGHYALLDEGREPTLEPDAGESFECLQIGVWNEHYESSQFYRSAGDRIFCLLLVQGNESSSYLRAGVAYLQSNEGILSRDTAIAWEYKELIIE